MSASLSRLLAIGLCFVGSDCFEIPLPGGKRIKIDNGGVIRIQLNPLKDMPPIPVAGTRPEDDTLASIEICDTGTTKGFGAFCLEPLKKHTFLGFYEGDLVSSREELENLDMSMDYVMSIDGGATFLDAFERAQNRETFSPVHLNHEDKNKKGCNCVRVLEEGSVAFFTSRDVEIGEELCFDYGKNYWQGRESLKI